MLRDGTGTRKCRSCNRRGRDRLETPCRAGRASLHHAREPEIVGRHPRPGEAGGRLFPRSSCKAAVEQEPEKEQAVAKFLPREAARLVQYAPSRWIKPCHGRGDRRIDTAVAAAPSKFEKASDK
mgnify:FL=1